MDELLDTAPCGFLSTTNDGSIAEVNTTLIQTLEYRLDELQGQPIKSIMPVASQVFLQTHILPLLRMHDRVDEVSLLLQTKAGKKVPVLLNAMSLKHEGDMSISWVFMPMHRRSEYEDQLLRIKRESEEAQRVLAARQEQLVEINASLKTMTLTDGLTGLKNYRAFKENLNVQIALTKLRETPLSLLLIDVDFFKSINDTFGHPVGDKYLKNVGKVLKGNSRGTDFVARYGGEEFAVTLPNTDATIALQVAEKLRNAVASAPWEERAITVSVGVSTLSSEISDAARLIASADQSLYRSKNRGRNCVTHARDLDFRSSDAPRSGF